ncbi:MAG: cellulase family glycosylhydrolase [Verrucomicrobiota bacterium]
MIRRLFCIAIVGWLFNLAHGAPLPREVVCTNAVLRWADTGEEVALFGVNYYPPHYTNFRDLGLLGVDREQTIRDDLVHFKRLRLDLLRLHVFERELSDAEGNLVENEHLRLLDYLISQCRSNGLYLVLTPIAWWPTPNPGNGFANRFTMNQMITDPVALPAQQRYLRQFMEHRNRYTGLTYAADHAVVAIELINEPLYPDATTDAQITTYINNLAAAVRESGSRKPIFYNGWQRRLKAVADAKIEGCTFGWYPSGLVAGHCLSRNFLPNVQDYAEMRSPVLTNRAKGVYEFDAADVPGGYLYPAMARSFRAGGAQFAAQFQYDPMPLAPFNAGWQTHYLNLIYAPQRALGFMIAADAFHTLARLEQSGLYPTNNVFGPRNQLGLPEFRVSFEENLSERVGDRVYLHSSHTRTRPPAPELLERVAGCGASPLVAYEGTGAYFLDRLAPGQWRLEVYPDAVWVNDPFGKDSLEREVSRILWRAWPMRLQLPDLGGDFSVKAVPSNASTAAVRGEITVTPGVYLLQRQGINAPPPAGFDPTFVAPKERKDVPPAIWHDVARHWVSGREYPVSAVIAVAGDPQVNLLYRPAATAAWQSLPMTRQSVYHYAAAIPAKTMQPGECNYRIEVNSKETAYSYPGVVLVARLKSLPASRPTVLFAASGLKTAPGLSLRNSPGKSSHSELVATADGGRALSLSVTGFGADAAASLRLAATVPPADASGDTVVVRARAIEEATTAFELGLVQADGNAFGFDVPLSREWQDIRIFVKQLHPLWGTQAKRPDFSRLKELSVIFGSWLYGERHAQPHGFELAGVRLEQSGESFQLPVLDARAAVPLFYRDEFPRVYGDAGRQSKTVRGSTGLAMRVSVPKFGPPPSSVSFKLEVGERLEAWRGQLGARQSATLHARAGEPDTTKLEILFIEDDGAAWGCNVPLTTQWRDIRISWDMLTYYRNFKGPAQRGQPGDHFNPEKLQAVNCCFGAWLFPQTYAQQHAVEIESLHLDAAVP